MGFGYYGFYYDPTYILVFIGVVLCGWASLRVNSVMNKYRAVPNLKGMTGREAAENILRYEGIYDVAVECLRQGQGDHYDPRTKTVRLSYENYNSATVTAVAVAAHECGHAKQHQEQYGFLRFRTALAPVASISTTLGFPIILLGLFLGYAQVLIEIGIWAFAIGVLFQLITLPVEFNASSRAMNAMQQYHLLTEQETLSGRKVLGAAAWTYVAAAAASILQLLRLVLLFGGRRKND